MTDKLVRILKRSRSLHGSLQHLVMQSFYWVSSVRQRQRSPCSVVLIVILILLCILVCMNVLFRYSKHKLRSPAVDGKFGRASNSSGGLASKDTGDTICAQREQRALSSHHSPTRSRARNTVEKQDRSGRDARNSNGLQQDSVVLAKAQRPVNPGRMAIYRDSPDILADQRNARQGDVKPKPGDIRPSPADEATGSVALGLTSRIDVEQSEKVNQNSVSTFDISKSPVPQDAYQEDDRKYACHLRGSSRTASDCRRRRTPNKAASHHSGSLADGYRKSRCDSGDRRRAVHSPGVAAGGDNVKRLASRWQPDQDEIDLSPSTLALLSRYHDSIIEVEKTSSPKSPDSGPSLSKRQGTPYKVRGVSFQKVTSISMEGHQDSQCPQDLSEGVHPGDERDRGGVGLHVPFKGSTPLLQGRTLPRALADCTDGEGLRPDVGSTKCSWSQGRNLLTSSEDAPDDDVSKWNTSNMDGTAAAHGSSAPLTLVGTGTSSSGSSSSPCLMSGASAGEHTVKSQDSVHLLARAAGVRGRFASVNEEAVNPVESEDHRDSSTPSRMDNSTAKCEEKFQPTLSAENGKLATSQKLHRIQKRLKSLGPPSRVLRSEGLESLSNSSSRISSFPAAPSMAETVSSLGNPSCDDQVAVARVTDSVSSILTAVGADKDGGQLGNLCSDPRKRKAERDPSSGDTSQNIEHSGLCRDGHKGYQMVEESCSTADSTPEKETEEVAREHHQVGAIGPLQGSISKDQSSRQFATKSRSGREGSSRGHQLPVKQTLAQTKPQAGISSPARSTGRVSAAERSAVSWQATLRSSKPANGDRRSSSSVSHRNGSAMGSTQAPKDSVQRTDRGRFPAGVNERVPPNGSVLSSIGPVLSKLGRQGESPDCHRSRVQQGAPESRPLCESAAMDASHSGRFPVSVENKENEPAVPQLSNCLESLSLVEEAEVPKLDGIRPPSHNHLSDCPLPPPTNASTTRQTTWTISEDGGAPLPTAHSERLLPSKERESPNIAANSLRHPEQAQAEDPPLRKDTQCARLLVDKARVEKPEVAVIQQSVREVAGSTDSSREKADAETKGRADDSSQVSGREYGMRGGSAATQRKLAENAQFVWVNDKRYQKLGKIGKGGSSEVYKVIDCECNIYALKKINLKGREHSIARGFYQEIEYLERLKGKQNVVQLIACEVTNQEVLMEHSQDEKITEDACIYMLLEFGEIDLAGILSKKRKQMQESKEIIDDNWLRFYWKHMLVAVQTIHEERIVHADLKPANFLLVKGELKLIDFGIAKAIQNDTTHIVRDSQVGTVNYMSPEAFMTNSTDEKGRVVKCGRASDIWSLGCILYQMVYGHTPYSQVTSFYAKIRAITSKNYKIEFPSVPDPWLLDVMKQCLTWDRYHRPHINDLLEHPFLRPELASRYNKLPSE